uniref:Tyrosine-protein phosphatase domain-containing protein n=1 Tax=Strongyloides papillosus TaxID=174720 RepID=A0A0N5B8Q7_STREA
MFIPLYIFVTALVLLTTSNQIGEEGHGEYFPSVPQNITNTTFPINYNITENSNIILVKCPYSKYKHIKKEDIFEIDSAIDKLKIKKSYNSTFFAWVPLRKDEPGSTGLKCGRVAIKSDNNPLKNRTWIYKLNWQNPSKVNISVEREKIQSTVKGTHRNCNNSEGGIFVLTEKQGGKIVEVDSLTNGSFHVNQKFYYFKTPAVVDNSTVIKYPCAIIQAYGDCPRIMLSSQDFPSIEAKIDKINTIDIEVNKTDVKVNLTIDGNSEYYRNEKISLTRMRYLKDGAENIKNSSILVNSNFTVDGFNIVNLTYICPQKQNNSIVSYIFYFGPKEKDYKLEEETVSYRKNDTTSKPNCTDNIINVGYLESISINGDNVNVTNLNNNDGIKGEFNHSEGVYSLEDISKNNTILQCIYRTPAGTIRTSTNIILIGSTKVISTNTTYNKKNGKHNIDKVYHKPKEMKKSWYQKLVDEHSKELVNFVIIVIIILIVIALLITALFVYKRMLTPHIKMAKFRREYPNVYYFWNDITSDSLTNYCKNITKNEYISDKLKNRKIVKRVEGSEEVEVGIVDLFDDSLINCYKKIDKKIKAHYVYEDSFNRKYLLSDGPTKDTEYFFWKMVFEEDIGKIVAIIYDKKDRNKDDEDSDVYWPEDRCEYGDIVIRCLSKIRTDTPSVSGYRFRLSKMGRLSKYFKIFHVSNWKEHDIPQSDYQFNNIYEEIFRDDRGEDSDYFQDPDDDLHRSVLINCSEGTGSRVYMLTYYLCIYDALLSSTVIENPMEVIKNIREKRYGGNISQHEYAYIIKALITTFFNNGILIDQSKHRLNFNTEYDKFLHNFLKCQARMDRHLVEFLRFVNTVDAGKMDEYKTAFYNLGRLPSNEIAVRCSRFFAITSSKYANKVRHKDIPCFNSTAINVKGKDITDLEGFIHANKFEYISGDDKEKKLILCQGPLNETRNDMLDMIYRYSIHVVVVLVKPEEDNPKYNKWSHYFPKGNEIFKTENYTVTRIRHVALNKDMISESEYLLENNRDVPHKFTIFNYQGWPDKDVPSEHMSFYNLYKRIVNFPHKGYIAIHCSDGIGRTGTLALIMYLIDTINEYPSFDPIARLKFLRDHRYLAIQKFNQFVFALLVVFEHFKKKIVKMNPSAFDDFCTLANDLFNKKDIIGKEKASVT